MATTTVTPDARRVHRRTTGAHTGAAASRASTAPSARPEDADIPGQQERNHEERNWTLDVVRPAPKRTGRSKIRLVFVAPVLVVLSLLAVAGAQAILTEGQVRLTNVQNEVSAAQIKRFDLQLQIAREEQPSAVIAAARAQGMIVPSVIQDIPAVSLTPPPSSKRTSQPGSVPPKNSEGGAASKKTSSHP